MILRHGFGLWMDGRLKKLLCEAPKVVLKAWALAEGYVPDRFTFEGKLSEGPVTGEGFLAYNQCGFEGYHKHAIGRIDKEAGKLVIRGLALKAIRHFLQSAGGATRIYLGVSMDVLIQDRPEERREVYVDGLELRFGFSASDYEAELEILGLNDYSVLTTRTIPGLDRWSIYPEEVRYVGLREKEAAEMPEWLKRTLEEAVHSTFGTSP